MTFKKHLRTCERNLKIAFSLWWAQGPFYISILAALLTLWVHGECCCCVRVSERATRCCFLCTRIFNRSPACVLSLSHSHRQTQCNKRPEGGLSLCRRRPPVRPGRHQQKRRWLREWVTGGHHGFTGLNHPLKSARGGRSKRTAWIIFCWWRKWVNNQSHLSKPIEH
jgi:hypothetical protein